MKVRKLRATLAAIVISVFLWLFFIPAAHAEVPLFNNENGYAVSNGPASPTQFTLNEPTTLVAVRTYHYNSGRGATAGTISLIKNGKIVYSAQASVLSKFYWVVRPNIVFPAGAYTISVSNPPTWSHNSRSGGKGFAFVTGENIPDEKGPVVRSYFQKVSPSDADDKGPVNLQTIIMQASQTQKPLVAFDRTAIKVGETFTITVKNALLNKRYDATWNALGPPAGWISYEKAKVVRTSPGEEVFHTFRAHRAGKITGIAVTENWQGTTSNKFGPYTITVLP